MSPTATIEEAQVEDRTTSPVDPVIIDYFHRQPKAPLYYVYSNSDRTRHFNILPTNLGMLSKLHFKSF